MMEVSTFIQNMPKLELHVHIEGTLTPQLRWELAKKNSLVLPYDSLDALIASYGTMYNHRIEVNGDNGLPTFLEAYYGGMEVLHDESDFYALAMQYFTKAAKMNVRYVESFFDIQAHTRRGVKVEHVMECLKRAKLDAEANLDVRCNWILCFLRDMSVEDAEMAYESCAPWRGDVFNAIGLDSNEYDRPSMLFDSILRRAREDGLHITAHCDVGQKDTHEHIKQAVTRVGGTGLDRIDHGLNAAERPELIQLLKNRGIGMTLCPHAYNRRNPPGYVFPLVRKLFDAGIRITINSDDPTYMHNMWVMENLQLTQTNSPFTDADMIRLQRNAIDICWALDQVKKQLQQELDKYATEYGIASV